MFFSCLFKYILALVFIFLGISQSYAVELNSTNITQAPFNCAISDQTCALGSKNITSIAPGTFDNHTSLVILDLTFNQIAEIPAGLFDNTPNLSLFAIYVNYLTTLPAGLFDNTPLLDYFSPALNQIIEIPAGLFDNTPNLRNLNMAFNQLTSLPDDLFANIPSFNSLRLDNNKLTNLSDDFFSGISSFNILQLDNNKLTNIPTSLQFITGVNTLRVANNCMVSGLSDGTIAYLDTYADDNPIWSDQQTACGVDYSIGLNFMDPVRAGMANVLQVYVNQSYNNPATGNYIEIYGAYNIMSINLLDNIGWSNPSLGVYRYDLLDSIGAVSEVLSLVGSVKQSIGNSSILLTGKIYTNSVDIQLLNNISPRGFFVLPSTNYDVVNSSNGTGYSGDIKNISINYDLLSGGYTPIDSLVVATLGSGVSMLSSGWQNTYTNGSLLISGDICYDGLLNEQGPYYTTIKEFILSDLGYLSIDDFLVQEFGYASDPTQEIERFINVCTSSSYLGYDSFAICLNILGLDLNKTNYPQCGGAKSFAHVGDMCYDDFLEEQGVYYTTLQDYILNTEGYSNLEDWLSDYYGIVSSPSEIGENVEDVCFSYMGYPNIEECFLQEFRIDVASYSTCGKQELPSLLAKLIDASTFTFDVDLQLTTNIQSGYSIVSQFDFLPSLLDVDVTNNTFIYSLYSPNIIPSTGVSNTGNNGIGGGGGQLIQNDCSNGTGILYGTGCSGVSGQEEISFNDSEIFNPSIIDGYCYDTISLPSIIDSSIIETSEEFKKSLAFMYTYGITRFNEVEDFDPYSYLTREQAAKFFSKFALNILCRKVDSGLYISYNDSNRVDPSLQTYITKAYQLGLMKGGNDGNFRPKDLITKAEFNAVVIRMILKTYLPEDHSDVWYSEYNKISKSLGIIKYGAANRPLTRNDATLILFRTYKNHSFSLQNIGQQSYVLSNRSVVIPQYTDLSSFEELNSESSIGEVAQLLSGDRESVSGDIEVSISGIVDFSLDIQTGSQRSSRPQIKNFTKTLDSGDQ